MCSTCKEKDINFQLNYNHIYSQADRITDELLRKKYEDNPAFIFTDWIILQEEILQLQIEEWFENQKNITLEKFDKYEESFSEKNLECVSFIKQLNKFSLSPKISYSQVGIFRFERNTIPIELKNIIKSKNSISDNIEIIGEVNTNPFLEFMNESSTKSINKGGQSAFAQVGIKLQFNMRDKLIEDSIKNLNIQLSDQVKQQLQSKIRFALYDGVRNGESVKQLRNRVLGVFNNPINVVVPPKILKGEVVRAGYTYQMSPKNWATTVASTEVAKGFMEGKLEGYKQMGVVEQVQYAVTPDERLCEICAPFEDQIFKLSEAGGLIPQHPRCRCTLIPYFPEDKKDELINTAKSNVESLYFPNLKGSLSTIENEISKLKYEKMYVLDNSGNIVYEKIGTKNKVSFNTNDAKLKNKILTHNHPNKNPAFSSADIITAIKHDVKELRAVGGNKVGIISRPKNGWGIDYNDVKVLFKKINDQVTLENSIKIWNNTLSRIEAERNHYTIVNEKLADMLGYKFKIIDLTEIKKSMDNNMGNELFIKANNNKDNDEIDDRELYIKHYTIIKLRKLKSYYEYFADIFKSIADKII